MKKLLNNVIDKILFIIFVIVVSLSPRLVFIGGDHYFGLLMIIIASGLVIAVFLISLYRLYTSSRSAPRRNHLSY